ncbi:MAG TPA: glycosyltransferase family 1 protein [Steroidobacter sp.]|nr:glycosyltransferase family 1 protein [Steroidobacter sp.]
MYRRTIGVMGRLLDQNDGLGLYGRNLLQEMLKLDPHSRYLIFLNTPQSQHMFDEFPNAQTCVAPARSKLWWDQVLVPLAARRHDVTLLFNPKFSIPLLTGRPCVFVHQGSDWYVNPQNYLWWDNLYIRLMLPLYDRKARLTLSISQATLDDLARLSPIDVSKSVVTYAGVSQNFTPQRDEAAIKQFLADYALPQRFILTVARVIHGGHPGQPFYPGGNNERLLRAWRRYRRAGGELPLVMAGARIEPYLRAQGFTDADLEDVFFPGFIPNARIHMAYQQAECFILATLCESFGIPILEALASGCPAIVPSTCASPEVAGGAARLIDPLDEDGIVAALLEVTGSPELRARMREQGLKRAHELTWKDAAARTLAAFERIAPVRAPAEAALSLPTGKPAT